MLRQAVSSILNQTFQDFEIVLVDDASTDNTPEVVKGLGDARIKYIRHQVNKGEAAAANTGVASSAGEYIAFLHDDDEWLPAKLNQQVKLLESSPPTVGAVYTGFLRVDRSTKKPLKQVIPSKRGNIFAEMAGQNWVGPPSTVVLRRECFERVGLFDESLTIGPDYDMWIRVSEKFHFDYVPEPLTNYSVHGNQVSMNFDLLVKGLEALLNKHGSYFASDSKNYSRRYAALGALYSHQGNIRNARKALLKAVSLCPLHLSNYVNLLLSFVTSNDLQNEEVERKV
jgi:glycosyltransferase involved in cell wall biosynthesis